MSDQHTEDVLALVRELSDLEFRRGQLHARLEWHFRLRELAAQAEPVTDAKTLRMVRAATANGPKRAGRDLQRRILAYLAETPRAASPRQVSEALGTEYESTRQALVRLKQAGTVTRNAGGGYGLAESHAGSGLVAAGA
jgi:hypothetical protein